MADLDACLRDGYSTAGSAGSGLGAVRRQSHMFDIFTRPGGGTAVLTEIKPGRPATGAAAPFPAWGGMALPIHGEDECGDSWAVCQHGAATTMLVADGLGHGPLVAAASRAAVVIFSLYHRLVLEDLARRIHEALRPTRGAAMALARIDTARHSVDYVGIGNISGTLVLPTQSRKMLSHNGTAGHISRKIQQFSYSYTGRPLVIMHSDGLGTSWSLDRYPGLAARHASLVSAVLYRDFTRGRDDVSVIAVSADE